MAVNRAARLTSRNSLAISPKISAIEPWSPQHLALSAASATHSKLFLSDFLPHRLLHILLGLLLLHRLGLFLGLLALELHRKPAEGELLS